jgi:single-strand DNA-binding protein
MAGETLITVVGNLTGDPELRFTPSGAAVANFTIASTPRNFDKNSNEWKDGDTLFLSCSIWRQAAENVAESLQKGMRVVAQGRLKQRSYETREGEKRTVVELDVEEVGPSLKYATAKVARVQRSGGGGGYSGGNTGGGDDPWASSTARPGRRQPVGRQPGWAGSQPGTAERPVGDRKLRRASVLTHPARHPVQPKPFRPQSSLWAGLKKELHNG